MSQFILFLVDHSDWRDGVAHGPFTNEDDARRYAKTLNFSDAKADSIERDDSAEFEYVLCQLLEVSPRISSDTAIALARQAWFDGLSAIIEDDDCTAEAVGTSGWIVTGKLAGEPFVTANVVSEGIVDDYGYVA